MLFLFLAKDKCSGILVLFSRVPLFRFLIANLTSSLLLVLNYKVSQRKHFKGWCVSYTNSSNLWDTKILWWKHCILVFSDISPNKRCPHLLQPFRCSCSTLGRKVLLKPPSAVWFVLSELWRTDSRKLQVSLIWSVQVLICTLSEGGESFWSAFSCCVQTTRKYFQALRSQQPLCFQCLRMRTSWLCLNCFIALLSSFPHPTWKPRSSCFVKYCRFLVRRSVFKHRREHHNVSVETEAKWNKVIKTSRP